MDLHEYQAKELVREFSIAFPPFFVATNLQEVEEIIAKQGLQEAVIKIQVHAGGRKKAGGVRIARSPSEILAISKELIGMKVVNAQTGPEGRIAHKILLTPLIHIAKEYYVGIAIDRKTASTSLIVSQEGGVDIESISATNPEKILVEKIYKDQPLHHYQEERITSFLGWTNELRLEGLTIIDALKRVFFFYDAELLEINPLVKTVEGQLLALDTKLTVDDNALFRQPRVAAMYDPTQITPQEQEAKEYDLAYVGLSGNIGCMVNGAGLAMATMDLIRLKGGDPANFLDVGGGASEEKVTKGFEILLSDPHVKAILVNIFGGIMNCEIIARALKAIVEKRGVSIPIVLRMEGTNVTEAKEIIKNANLQIITADSLDEAAEKVVSCQF